MPPITRSDIIPIVGAEDPMPGLGTIAPRPRPAARDSTRRNHVVSVRLSAEQLERVDKDRAGCGLRRGPYLRMAAFGRMPRSIPPINRDAWQALRSAFEHLARVSDSLLDRPHFHSEVVRGEVQAIETELSRIRRELLGLTPPSAAGE